MKIRGIVFRKKTDVMIFVTTVDITTTMLYDNVYSKRVFSAIFSRVWLTFQDGKYECEVVGKS